MYPHRAPPFCHVYVSHTITDSSLPFRVAHIACLPMLPFMSCSVLPAQAVFVSFLQSPLDLCLLCSNTFVGAPTPRIFVIMPSKASAAATILSPVLTNVLSRVPHTLPFSLC